MLHHLVPEDERLRALRHRFEVENPLRGKSGRLIREPVEAGDEESGDEMHDHAEGNLHRDQRVHETAAGMRIFAALEGAHRLDGGGAQRGREAE